MKLTKLAKSVLAASALTVASFGANAGAIATSEFTISGFGIYSSPGVILEGVDISFSDFFGSTVGTGTAQKDINEIFTNPGETDFDQDGLGYTNFGFDVVDGVNSASVAFTGFHLDPGPVSPTGTTFAHAEVTGTDIAGATSILENSAKFTWDNDNQVAGESVAATFSYNYVLNLLADSTVSWEMGIAEAFGSFVVTLFGSDNSFQNVFDINVTDQDLDNIASAGAFSKGITLTESVKYTLKVVQTSDVDVRSVAEPTSVAILGLGLLGLAGAARRRKS